MADTKTKKPRTSRTKSASADAATAKPVTTAAPIPDAVATPAATSTVTQTAKHEGKSMSSILEFSQDVDSQEAPAPLPVGTYPATIERAEVRTSQSSGNQYVALVFRIPADAFPPDFTDGNQDGEVLTYNRLSYEDTPRGRHRMKRFADAVGITIKGSLDVNDLIGLTANVGIGQEEYEGENRAVIQKILAAD